MGKMALYAKKAAAFTPAAFWYAVCLRALEADQQAADLGIKAAQAAAGTDLDRGMGELFADHVGQCLGVRLRVSALPRIERSKRDAYLHRRLLSR